MTNLLLSVFAVFFHVVQIGLFSFPIWCSECYTSVLASDFTWTIYVRIQVDYFLVLQDRLNSVVLSCVLLNNLKVCNHN